MECRGARTQRLTPISARGDTYRYVAARARLSVTTLLQSLLGGQPKLDMRSDSNGRITARVIDPRNHQGCLSMDFVVATQIAELDRTIN